MFWRMHDITKKILEISFKILIGFIIIMLILL